ncbi:MAG TPA: NlpC/P60 family protein [Chthonomonadaceae bacterium]|nr:NlpC/P60 family protein [Chthonomonadaceae bacterium]
MRLGWGATALLGLVGIPAASRADGTLTLELPPSQNALAMRQSQASQASQLKARTTVVPRSSRAASRRRSARMRGRYASRGGSVERIVGRLGQLERQSRIYREPSTQSQLLTVAPTGTYVAIQQDAGAWCGVLMADGSTGWLPVQNVKLLDYQVVSNGSPVMPSGMDQGDVYPHTGQPLLVTEAQAILQEAYKYMGVRYVWGGNGYSGIDCSGFVKNVFGACGYRLPRTATEQMAYGVPVPMDQLQAGDRLYFGHKKNGAGVTHTGIYIGNGYFIHSSSSRGGVAVSRLSEPLYARIYVCARR